MASRATRTSSRRRAAAAKAEAAPAIAGDSMASMAAHAGASAGAGAGAGAGGAGGSGAAAGSMPSSLVQDATYNSALAADALAAQAAAAAPVDPAAAVVAAAGVSDADLSIELVELFPLFSPEVAGDFSFSVPSQGVSSSSSSNKPLGSAGDAAALAAWSAPGMPKALSIANDGVGQQGAASYTGDPAAAAASASASSVSPLSATSSLQRPGGAAGAAASASSSSKARGKRKAPASRVEDQDDLMDMANLSPSERKRRERLAKNRESARECRRRKKERVEELQSRVELLEREAAVLRERLRANKEESAKEEVEEKARLKAEMGKALARNCSDEEIVGLISQYRERFADYGQRRRTAVQYHIDQLERLLKPTQVTRMCMWSLHQEDDFYKEKEADPGSAPTMWHFLCDELKVSPEQARKIKQYRHHIRELSAGLKETLDVLRDLRLRAQSKNAALDNAMSEMQGILTPTQAARFILWVHRNPVCMQMLNNLWSVLPK